MYKKLALIFIFILTLTNAFALINESSIRLFAVTEDGQGTDAKLTINIDNGNGKIWSSIDSLVGTSTQNTEKTAVNLLQNKYPDYNKYDYFFSISSIAKVVDGPSAGLPTALLLQFMFANKSMPDYVSGTGTISTNGTIGKIGGILEKTKYAASTGIKIFFVPKSELEVVIKENDEIQKVNLSNYAYEKYNIKVIGIENIFEALNYNLSDTNNVELLKIDETPKQLYNPPNSEINENLKDFKDYILNYSQEVKTNLDNTEKKLNESDLKDNDLLNELYSNYFTKSKEFYDLGKSAYDKGYLYASANYYFNANIYLNYIQDVILNTTTITDYTELNKLTTELQKEYDYNYTNMSCTNYEWQIASQERYLWAQKKIDEVIYTIPKNKYENIARYFEYEQAKEWLKMSKMFLNYVKSDNCYLKEIPYKQSSEQIMSEIKKANTIIEKYELYDSSKWIDGAKNANDKNWYFTSIFENATALAFINSYLETKDLDNTEIKDKAEELIKYLDDQNKEYIWYNIYLQNSHYYLKEAEFYENNNDLNKAKESYQISYQMALFSKHLFDVVDDIEKNKQSISYIKENDNYTKITWNTYKIIIVLSIITILGLLIIAITFYRKIQNKDKMLEKIRDDYNNKRISLKEYVERVKENDKEYKTKEIKKDKSKNKSYKYKPFKYK